MKDEGVIVRTKLDTPLIKSRILRRERLLGTLRENLDKKLILICADAGYGKTTLLTQFCYELKRPFIFYDLDSKDNGTAAFFNHLVAGMKKYAADFGAQELNIPQPSSEATEIYQASFS